MNLQKSLWIGFILFVLLGITINLETSPEEKHRQMETHLGKRLPK